MNKSWPLIFMSFAGGIGLVYYRAWPALLLIAILLIMAASLYCNERPRILLCMLIIGGGMLYYHFMALELPSELPIIKSAELRGRVKDFPYFDGQKTSFLLKTENPSPYQKNIRVVCLFDSGISRGDVVKLRGDLKPPSKPGNPGEFDYPAYLAGQGVYYTLSLKRASELSLIAPESGLLKWVDSFRSQGEKLTQEVLPQQESSILLGMLLGSREGMDDKQYDDFQKTGIVHLFSVSGLHVGFVLLLVAWLTSLTRVSSRGRFIIGVSVLLLYGTMVGWPAPVIRAVIMSSLGLLAYYTGRENSLLNALAISGIIILLINPGSLFNLSFQLTFLATWGLVDLFPLLRDSFPYKGWVWDLVLIPVAAELAVLPLIAYHFNLFTPVSILTNILVTYLSGGAVILGFITLFLAPILQSLAALFLYPAGLFIEMILYIVQGVKALPGAYLWVATPVIGMMVLYYIAIFMGVLALKNPQHRRYFIPATALLLAFIIGLLIPAGYYNRGSLEIVFIDVGQGDAILMKSPQGKFLLVDGGGSQLYDVGAKKVLPYLHYRGIRQLEMLINTHPDIDHLQGLESVAIETEVEYLGLPESIKDRKEYRNLKSIANSHRTTIVPLRIGQFIKLEEGLEIKVLHPEGESYSGNDFNQQSVVLQIKYGDFSALLSGDMPTEVMSTVIKEADNPITLVKVPHHGSKGSLLPAFYQDLQPRYAVISVADNNPFGHPHPAVLEMLAQEGIQVLRTDQDGAVIVRSDGRELTVSCTKTKGK
ncbi:MAG: DNA internalization-related competence protein ComEC/Rec2 [Firmicutes bacterium HGW-Firmicutes-15]|nr:MAG: DNA internalization-related competence protein ComEC/Rec2 [Firmicutes bacterium HGW-Firmicutes-15]